MRIEIVSIIEIRDKPRLCEKKFQFYASAIEQDTRNVSFHFKDIYVNSPSSSSWFCCYEADEVVKFSKI